MARPRKIKEIKEGVTPLRSRVTRVTVYRNRAAVTRVAATTLAQGPGQILIGPLPAHIDEYSLRVTGRGESRVRILSARIRRLYVPADEGRASQLREALEKAQEERDALEVARARAAHRAEQLRLMAEGIASPLNRALARGQLAINDAGNVLNFYYDQLAKADREVAVLVSKIKDKDKQLAEIKFNLAKVETPQPFEEKAAEITYECDRPGPFEFAVTYVVPNAGWEPSYDLRALPDEGQVEVGYLAAVYQRTGEDWNEAALTLSTASPALGAAPPTLNPRYVNFSEVAPLRAAPAPYPEAVAGTAAREKKEAAEELDEGARPDQLEEAEIALAQVADAAGVITFALSAPATVPADGEPHVVGIARERLAAEFKWFVVPEVSEHAFLFTKIKNTTPFTFMPGVANMSRGDEYVGRTNIARTAPGDEIEMFFGPDDRLKVKYESRRRADEAAGLTGSSQKVTVTSQTDLENLSRKEINAVVKQRLPVSLNADIKLKVTEAQPKPDDRAADGIHEWRLRLAPGAKTTVLFAYEVTWPRGRKVVGI